MGRESNINDPIVIQSSIALLQERFRQLQRMKEMREERELLRKQLAMPEPSRLFFHFLPPTTSPPPPQPPAFSLWSGSRSKCMEAPLFASLFPTVTETPRCMHVSMNKLEDSDCDDVDTSLHL